MKYFFIEILTAAFFFHASASDSKSIRDFNVIPTNSPKTNKVNLQKAIDWASAKGAALFVEPSDEPYPMEGGLILKKNVSLIGANGPTPRGTSHPTKKQPVGSVFKITDTKNVFLTVESATQVKGIQFWYPEQTINDPPKDNPLSCYHSGITNQFCPRGLFVVPHFLRRIFSDGF